jgi:diguanylate cyclase (GGDEF)-like protein
VDNGQRDQDGSGAVAPADRGGGLPVGDDPRPAGLLAVARAVAAGAPPARSAAVAVEQICRMLGSPSAIVLALESASPDRTVGLTSSSADLDGASLRPVEPEASSGARPAGIPPAAEPAVVDVRDGAGAPGRGDPDCRALRVVADAGLPPAASVGLGPGATVSVIDPATGATLLAGPAAPVLVEGVPVAFVGAADRRSRRWTDAERAQLELVAAILCGPWSAGAALAERQRLATFDPVTGLPNRAGVLARIDAAADAGTVTVVSLGVDRFRRINDGLGRSAGDRVLRHLAAVLAGALRSGETAGRTEGDRFVVVATGAAPGSAGALRTAERLRAALSTTVVVEGHRLGLSVTAGVARGRAPDTAAELLRSAEAAMELGKERGRATTVVSSPQQRDRALRRLEAELSLRAAVADGDLRLHYQPVLDLHTGELAGVEALVRWEVPGRGMVAPSEFIPLAEETGLIVALGGWVLHEACSQIVDWPTGSGGGPPPQVAVNLSARQIADRSLVGRVSDTLDATGLDPARLVLEITESALMADAEAAMAVLGRLRDLGVGLSVDDFGTGYSSLSYLKRFPVDSLKIDRSFVDGLGSDPNDSAIVGATIRLADALGLVSVAEGIESAEQAAELRRLGCSLGQGYFFGRPAPAADAAGHHPAGTLPRGRLAAVVAFPRNPASRAGA